MAGWISISKATIDINRLLIITSYADSVTQASEETCYQSNRLMMEMADEIVIGYASTGGNLERLCGEHQGKQMLNFECSFSRS